MPETRIRLKSLRRRIALTAALIVAASAAHAAAPLAYVTSEKAGVGVIDLDRMMLAKAFPVGVDGPRGSVAGTSASRRMARS